jgi:transcriptional regulator with XRE-family HTH domain
MNKVKHKIPGRPRRSQNEVDLHALGQRIRQIRGNVTQEDFAQSLGISQAQLSKYELGQSTLPLGALIKLAQISGRAADWILTGKSQRLT